MSAVRKSKAARERDPSRKTADHLRHKLRKVGQKVKKLGEDETDGGSSAQAVRLHQRFKSEAVPALVATKHPCPSHSPLPQSSTNHEGAQAGLIGKSFMKSCSTSANGYRAWLSVPSFWHQSRPGLGLGTKIAGSIWINQDTCAVVADLMRISLYGSSVGDASMETSDEFTAQRSAPLNAPHHPIVVDWLRRTPAVLNPLRLSKSQLEGMIGTVEAEVARHYPSHVPVLRYGGSVPSSPAVSPVGPVGPLAPRVGPAQAQSQRQAGCRTASEDTMSLDEGAISVTGGASVSDRTSFTVSPPVLSQRDVMCKGDKRGREAMLPATQAGTDGAVTKRRRMTDKEVEEGVGQEMDEEEESEQQQEEGLAHTTIPKEWGPVWYRHNWITADMDAQPWGEADY